jgi:hypothetical protein
MKYSVTWATTAENDLADLWMNAEDPGVVRQAADFIDDQLARDPYALSESRGGNLRIMMVSPLVARYRVYEDTATVIVRAIWSSRKV